MNILVLGGTGAMGTHLVDLLAARGDTVTVTSRRNRSNKGFVNFAIGNAKDQIFIQSLLAERWDAIVDFMVYSTAEFEGRVDRLLEATSHYLYLSSARVYADSEIPITEDTPRLLDVCTDNRYLSTDEYALAKARQEDILFQSIHKNWTIVRPYITYSADRLQLGVLEKEDWLYRALHGRTMVLSAEIHEKTTTLTYGADVASGMAALVCNPKAYSEAFHITASPSVSWSQVLDTYLSVLESHAGKRPIVSWQELPEFTRWRKGKYQIIYDRLYHRRFNNQKIDQLIDTSAFFDPLTGLRQSLEQFLQSITPQFREISWCAEGIKDRQLGERTPLVEIIGTKNKLKYFLFRHSELGQFLK